MNGFQAALRVLPERLRHCAARLPEHTQKRVEEFRLRLGREASFVAGGKEQPLCCGEGRVSAQELRRVLELCTKASPYAAAECLRGGYATAFGGVRVGLCGEAITENGAFRSVGTLSSVVIRIPREVLGCASGLVTLPFSSTLIVSPPGGGKTTLLRDMLRQLSDAGMRCALCDEKGEVAAFCPEGFGFDVGRCTDVLTGSSKSEAAVMLLRNMGAQLLAMDEITREEDAQACMQVSRCGVALLATAHGGDWTDLMARPFYRELLGRGVFRRAVIITQSESRRLYREEWLKE